MPHSLWDFANGAAQNLNNNFKDIILLFYISVDLFSIFITTHIILPQSFFALFYINVSSELFVRFCEFITLIFFVFIFYELVIYIFVICLFFITIDYFFITY